MNTATHTKLQNLGLQKFIGMFLPETRNSLNGQKFELTKISALLISVFKDRFDSEITVCDVHHALHAQNYNAYTMQSGYVVKTNDVYTGIGSGNVYYYIIPDRMAQLRYLITKNTDNLPLHILANIYELDKQIDLFKKLHYNKAVRQMC